MPSTASEALLQYNAAIGQHILRDTTVLEQATELVPTGDTCVEIGPGPGTMTRRLLERGNRVVAYEVDERFKPQLDRLRTLGDLEVRWGSILDAPDSDINGLDEFHVTGNIPFHISEPLVSKLTGLDFQSAVMIVGSRLAGALTAEHPGQPQWSRISLISRAFFETDLVAEVPRTSFEPVPRADGALIRQTRLDANEAWRSDPLTVSYRALVEADEQHTTVARALKAVAIDTRGRTGAPDMGSNRSKRRATRETLRSYLNSLNNGGSDMGDRPPLPELPTNMLSAISASVDERLLSRPLSGISNQDLKRICSAISTAVNRRSNARRPRT